MSPIWPTVEHFLDPIHRQMINYWCLGPFEDEFFHIPSSYFSDRKTVPFNVPRFYTKEALPCVIIIHRSFDGYYCLVFNIFTMFQSCNIFNQLSNCLNVMGTTCANDVCWDEKLVSKYPKERKVPLQFTYSIFWSRNIVDYAVNAF